MHTSRAAYPAERQRLAARLLDCPWHTSGLGRGWSDPALWDAWCGIGAVDMCKPMPPSPPGRSRTNDPSGKGASPMRNSMVAVIGAAIGTAGAHAIELPFPAIGDNHYLDLIA